ncbi:MAG TPA: FAD-dependent oxidoreductase, partial [Chloroflexia bacterium]|nr:FAD-dependent oxidoreductase [Chloroflexia bacterium]
MVMAAPVLAPASVEEAAALLREHAAQPGALEIRGGGSKAHLGNRTRPAAIVLSTHRLDRLVAYEPSDLTVTVEAGMGWDALQATLGARGQWLPLDPP